MAEITNKEKIKILEQDLKTLKNTEYLLVVRGQAAEKIGNKQRIEQVEKQLTDIVAEVQFFEEKIKECQDTEK